MKTLDLFIITALITAILFIVFITGFYTGIKSVTNDVLADARNLADQICQRESWLQLDNYTKKNTPIIYEPNISIKI